MLFGALKSRSISGVWSVVVFIICPLLLFSLFTGTTFIPVTEYGKAAYGNPLGGEGFFGLNQQILSEFLDKNIGATPASITTNEQYREFYSQEWSKLVFHSQTGIIVTRFIAFAYMYHYLNWFSREPIAD